jgi:hypothetical protein
MFDALAPCWALAGRAKTAEAKSESSLINDPLRVIRNRLLKVTRSYRTRPSGTLIAVKRTHWPSQKRFDFLFNQETV